MSGLVMAGVVIPVFMWRHYVVDKGVFPKEMQEDMHLATDANGESSRAGVLPYLALGAAVVIVYITSHLAS